MRLNLGAGGRRDEGWTHLDRAGGYVEVIHDLTEPLPFEDESVEGAVAHHVLDLLGSDQLADVLREVRRVLLPGGMFRVSSADMESAIDAALTGDEGWFPEPRGTLEESVGWFVTQGGARRTRLNPERLQRMLTDAGFAWVAHQDHGRTLGPDWLVDLDDRPGESFFTEACK